MNKNPGWKQALFIASAAGVIGFAAYGVYHTVDAAQALAENTAIISSDSIKYDPAVSGGCSPYGCAGCTVCTALQFQQNSEITPAYQIEQAY